MASMPVNKPGETNTHYKNNGNDADSTATQQSDAYFKDSSSGVYTGGTAWDFTNIWEIDEGVSLPTLQWLNNIPTASPAEISNDNVRLIPFLVSTDDTYIIEAGNEYFRFVRDGG